MKLKVKKVNAVVAQQVERWFEEPEVMRSGLIRCTM